MPMGITNATETFQMLMNKVFEGLINKICQVYLDDIIIYSNNIKDHLYHVQLVANRLEQHNLKIKLEKCKIAQKKIEYLSHVISNGYISPSQNKVKDLTKFKSLLNAKQIHSFLGLAGYYRKFIKNFSTIASPLLIAAQEKEINWSNECQESFDILLNALISEPITKLPRFDMRFELFTDASNYSIGSVLAQNYDDFDHPVAYYSKHLSRQQRNYSTTERELLSIVLSTEHFKQFLYGINFTVWTDHMPLKYLLSIKDPASRLLRWMNRLNMFEFQIKYIKGAKNISADALSRLSTETDQDENAKTDEIFIINLIIASIDPLNNEQATDPDISWFHNLKVQAFENNVHQIVVKDLIDVEANNSQRSLYAQLSRIQLLNGTLYRIWTNTTTTAKQ